MYELLHLQTLYIIREHVTPITLLQLCNEIREFLISNKILFTSFEFGRPLEPVPRLCKDGFLQVFNSEQEDITNIVQDMSNYDLLRMLRMPQEKPNDQLYIKLTDKLHQIQDLLGFSLTEAITRQSRNGYSLLVCPTFNQPNYSLVSDVFVIMPFQETFNYLYQNSIKAVCEHLNITCMRADDIYASDAIMHDIWSLIYNSKVIIADCTGKNPNVMYELGIAHTLGKNIVLMTQNVNDIPFDLQHLRHMHYEYAPHTIKQFENDLNKSLSQYFE